MLSFGDFGSDFSRTLLFSIVPLVLIIHMVVIGGDTSLYHINHQFTLLYNDYNAANGKEVTYDNEELIAQATTISLVLELRVYLKHNFGLTSLAGMGTITLPNEPGTHDIIVPTWRPISSSGISMAKGRMYDFYLGSTCCDIGPRDPVSTATFSEKKFEHDMDTDIQLFSKAGLHTEGSGSIHVKVNIMHNYFKDGDAAEALSVEESSYHRVKMRETVDEVLSRVRRNKRGRMARVTHTSSSSDQTTRIKERTVNSTLSAAAEEAKDMSRDRTAEVLNRVLSRRKYNN